MAGRRSNDDGIVLGFFPSALNLCRRKMLHALSASWRRLRCERIRRSNIRTERVEISVPSTTR
jgi:hypothetical protein